MEEIRFDKTDNKIISLLGEREFMNYTNLKRISFCREGDNAFKNRLHRLKELNVISVNTYPYRNGMGYTIKLV